MVNFYFSTSFIFKLGSTSGTVYFLRTEWTGWNAGALELNYFERVIEAVNWLLVVSAEQVLNARSKYLDLLFELYEGPEYEKVEQLRKNQKTLTYIFLIFYGVIEEIIS